MADSPTSSLTHTFESLCVDISKDSENKSNKKKHGKKIRHNSDSVFSVDKSKG